MTRYNSTFKSKPPAKLTFAEALARRLAKHKAKVEKPVSGAKRRRTKALRAKRDPKMEAWSREVKKRANNQCQWPGIKDYIASAPADFKISIRLAVGPCATGDQRIDAHHIAERSLRPDLKYSLDNAICLCRTHHDWLPLNRQAAIALKLLSDETYEASQKQRRAA